MKLIFCIHNHQPYGQLDYVMENCYQKAYWPLLNVFAESPQTKLTLHCTGVLWDFIERKHPEYLDLCGVLLQQNRLELLTGGYYEPIMPAIPREHRKLQIKKLTKKLHGMFDVQPSVMWLAERVWEPQITEDLLGADVAGLLLDEELFADCPGFASGGGGAWYGTVDGNTDSGLTFFAIDTQLRHAVPFLQISEAVDILRRRRDAGLELVTFADDGEKLGAWPGTHDWVYNQKWLRDFLRDSCELADFVLPSECIGSSCGLNARTISVHQVSPGSYAEMMDWAGGNWHNFSERYRECKRMQYVALETERAGGELDDILASEANDAYWHGLFGGLYLPNLRRAVTEAQLRAMSSQRVPYSWHTLPANQQDDFGLVKLACWLLVLSCSGGTVPVVGLLQPVQVISETMTRYPESYHPELEHLSGTKVPVDWHTRGSLVDHFLRDDATPDGFARGEYPEEGDFCLAPYEVKMTDSQDDPRLMAHLLCNGKVWMEGRQQPLRLEKALACSVEPAELRVLYTLTAPAPTSLLNFAPEWHWALSSLGYGAKLFVNGLLAPMPQDLKYDERSDVSHVRVEDYNKHFWAEMTIDPPCDTLWRIAHCTYSRAEHGPEEVFQSLLTMPIWRIMIEKEWRCRLIISAGRLT
jgi:hypothetical protein